MPDMLDEIFDIQGRLNDRTFVKNNILGSDGKPLSMESIRRAVAAGELGPNGLPNQWLRNYLWALADECRELDEELLKKWWSKDKVDMQNVRVEIVDMLHFLVSLAMSAGMTAEEFHRLYMKKNEVNFARQEKGYSMEKKTDEDNKTVV
jgi:dimeric dUTPase (all-alpha-NTP-PPase superfamily)